MTVELMDFNNLGDQIRKGDVATGQKWTKFKSEVRFSDVDIIIIINGTLEK